MDNIAGYIVDWFIILAYPPVLGGLLIYIVRLEIRMAKMGRDVCWIKKILKSNAPDPEQ